METSLTPKLDAYIASWPRVVPEKRAWVGCFAGMRGSGKTCSSAAMVFTEALCRGKKVYSNIPIGATLHYQGEYKTFAAEPLDLDILYSFDDRMRDAWVYIDEANYQIEAKRSSTTQNLLFADLCQQIRKRHISIVFTTIFETWLDFRVRQMMDFCARCKDVSYGSWGHSEGIGEGNLFDIEVEDWTGLLTGESYFNTGRTSPWSMMGRITWQLVDSYNIQDIFEARKRVKVEFDQHTLMVGKNAQTEDYREKFGDVQMLCENYSDSGIRQVPCEDVYDQCHAVTRKEVIALGRLLKNCGVEKRQTSRGYAFVLPEPQEARTLVGAT